MVTINWTHQAKNDLISIAEFIGQNSKKYARIQIKRIRERIHQLSEHPNSGRVVSELENPRIRELVSKGSKLLEDWLNSDYCKRNNITANTVAEVVKQAIINPPELKN